MSVVYRSGVPDLVVEHVSGASSNCYHTSEYRVRRARQRLSFGQLVVMHNAGLFGGGQVFQVRSQCDGKEEPSEQVDALPTDLDHAGRPTGKPALNWNGQLLTEPIKEPVFTYVVHAAVDSGD